MGNLFLELSNRGKNGPARWLGGTAVVLFFWLILGGVCSVPFLLISGAFSSVLSNPQGNLSGNDLLAQGDPFWVYLSVSVGFIFIWLGLWVALRFIHHRPFLTLITSAPRVNWLRLAEGFGLWFAIGIVFAGLEYLLYPSRFSFTFDPGRWFFFLPFVLILTPIQTSAEELLFRGYWLQGTGRLTRNFIILCIVNGILFALPHMLNPEVVSNPNETVLLFLNYGLTGAALALFTLRDNRLELALGAHAANNLFAGLVINYTDSALTTPSILLNNTLDANFGLVTLVITCIVFYAVAFRVWDRTPAPQVPHNEPSGG